MTCVICEVHNPKLPCLKLKKALFRKNYRDKTRIIRKSSIRNKTRRNSNILTQHTRRPKTAAYRFCREWLKSWSVTAKTCNSPFLNRVQKGLPVIWMARINTNRAWKYIFKVQLQKFSTPTQRKSPKSHVPSTLQRTMRSSYEDLPTREYGARHYELW